MTIGRDGAAVQELRDLFRAGPLRGLSDGELLRRFAAASRQEAEAAFAELVGRHGPMVLRVCRGILADHHDAHDAFQATFLILVRKGRGLWVRDSLGPWLHRVALRAASAARAGSAARRRHEEGAAMERPACTAMGTHGMRGEWEAVLHEEVARLPERYRVPLVLASLEGLPQDEVARRLGWPIGTVKSRMARGRARLKERLGRRGIDGPGMLSGWVPAPLPAAWTGRTGRAAVEFLSRRGVAGGVPASSVILAEGVLRSMFIAKIRGGIVGAIACAGLAAGVGAWAGAAGPQDGGPAGNGPSSSPKVLDVAEAPKLITEPKRGEDPATKKDLARIQGSWKITELHVGGREISGKEAYGGAVSVKFERLTFEGDKMYVTLDGKRAAEGSTFTLDAAELPRTFDFKNSAMKMIGIYEFDGQHLRICFHSTKRPSRFESKEAGGPPFNVLYELDRE